MKFIQNGVVYYIVKSGVYSSYAPYYYSHHGYATKFYRKLYNPTSETDQCASLTNIICLAAEAANVQSDDDLPKEWHLDVREQLAELKRFASVYKIEYDAERWNFYRIKETGCMLFPRKTKEYVSTEKLISMYNCLEPLHFVSVKRDHILRNKRFQHLNLQRTKKGWKVHNELGVRLVSI